MVESYLSTCLRRIKPQSYDFILLDNRCSTIYSDSGWDNPFRPDGDLSREADEIVNLIKGTILFNKIGGKYYDEYFQEGNQ